MHAGTFRGNHWSTVGEAEVAVGQEIAGKGWSQDQLLQAANNSSLAFTMKQFVVSEKRNSVTGVPFFVFREATPNPSTSLSADRQAQGDSARVIKTKSLPYR